MLIPDFIANVFFYGCIVLVVFVVVGFIYKFVAHISIHICRLRFYGEGVGGLGWYIRFILDLLTQNKYTHLYICVGIYSHQTYINHPALCHSLSLSLVLSLSISLCSE